MGKSTDKTDLHEVWAGWQGNRRVWSLGLEFMMRVRRWFWKKEKELWSLKSWSSSCVGWQRPGECCWQGVGTIQVQELWGPHICGMLKCPQRWWQGDEVGTSVRWMRTPTTREGRWCEEESLLGWLGQEEEELVEGQRHHCGGMGAEGTTRPSQSVRKKRAGGRNQLPLKKVHCGQSWGHPWRKEGWKEKVLEFGIYSLSNNCEQAGWGVRLEGLEGIPEGGLRAAWWGSALTPSVRETSEPSAWWRGALGRRSRAMLSGWILKCHKTGLTSMCLGTGGLLRASLPVRTPGLSFQLPPAAL